MSPVNPAADLAATFRPPIGEEDLLELGQTVKPVTVRMPAGRYLWVRAMAEQSGRSVTAMANELLGVGISGVLGHMDLDVRKEIEERVADLAEALGVQGEEL